MSERSNTARSYPRGKPSNLFPAILILLCTSALGLAYLTTVIIRYHGLYDFIKVKPPTPFQVGPSMIGQPLNQLDPILAYLPAKNSTGAFLLPYSDPLPFHNDEDNLRTPLGVQRTFTGTKHPRLLFLDDSYTYGNFVLAEDTFAYRSAQILGGESLNAGVPGYGLAQMLLRAEQLVPKYRPDYLIVQYSPWLVTRSETGYATDAHNLLMAPYFYAHGNTIRTAIPPFIPELDFIHLVTEYRFTPQSLQEELKLFLQFGFAFFFKKDMNTTVFEIKRFVGLVPMPVQAPERITQYAYQRFNDLAHENGSRLIILALGTQMPLYVPYDLFPKDAVIVNGWAKLAQRLNPMTSDEYIRNYFISRGDPPIPVDSHPNEKADAIVADAIVNEIQWLETAHQSSANQNTELPSSRTRLPIAITTDSQVSQPQNGQNPLLVHQEKIVDQSRWKYPKY